jgi:hypothetical protein
MPKLLQNGDRTGFWVNVAAREFFCTLGRFSFIKVKGLWTHLLALHKHLSIWSVSKSKHKASATWQGKKKSKITDEEEMNIIHMIIYRKSKSIHGETVKISK